MLLLPPGNGSDACAGLDARNALRPPITPELNITLMVLNIAQSGVYFLSLFPLYYYRNEPRFQRIRPFSLSAMMVIILILYLQGCYLPAQVVGFPCALELLIHLMGYAYTTSVFCARAMIFVCESQYALLLSKESSYIPRERTPSTANSSSASSHQDEEDVGFIEVSKRVFAVAFLGLPLESLSLKTLSSLRRRYFEVFLCILVPPFIVYLIAVLAVPQYRAGCSNCGLTLEFFITCLVYPGVICLPFMLRFIQLARRFKSDPQNVKLEFLGCVVTSPLWTYLGYALAMADPGGLDYNRKFAFSIIVSFCAMPFWIFVVFVQLLQVYRHKRARLRFLAENTPSFMGSSNHKTFLDRDSNDEVRMDFRAYVNECYALELLNFVEDVRAYKNQFQAHNDVWRRKKARGLVQTYIKVGAPMEVNISERDRNTVLSVDTENDNVEKLVTMFDKASNEVTSLLRSIYMEFTVKKIRDGRKKSVTNNTAIAPKEDLT